MCELMFSVFLENFYRFLLFENVEVGTLFHYLRKMMTMMINAQSRFFLGLHVSFNCVILCALWYFFFWAKQRWFWCNSSWIFYWTFSFWYIMLEQEIIRKGKINKSQATKVRRVPAGLVDWSWSWLTMFLWILTSSRSFCDGHAATQHAGDRGWCMNRGVKGKTLSTTSTSIVMAVPTRMDTHAMYLPRGTCTCFARWPAV